MITNLNKATFPGVALPLADSNVSATTGSPTTTTYTDSGINYKAYAFTGSGSITTTKAGLIDVLVVAGGGGGGYSNYGAGAGGLIYQTSFFVTSGTETVTVGAGGTNTPTRGGQSAFGNLTAVGGGFVRFNVANSSSFGGSSGSGNGGSTVGQNVAGQGNIGGVGASAAGGGGAGGAGGNTGAAGAGLANSITGTSVTYATGGANNTGSGTANTGNGAGGSGTTNSGGSGIVVVRVRA